MTNQIENIAWQFAAMAKSIAAESRKNMFEIVVTLYVLGGIITFGHSAAHADCSRESFVVSCTEIQIYGGIVSAAAWPLYWSWVAFDQTEAAQ